MQFKRLDGQKFGRLTVWAYHGKNKHGIATWFCECECGGIKIAPSGSLVCGFTKSCGCIGKEHPSHTKHGDKGKRIYNIWKSMNERCNCETSCSYSHYGARGISICPEWKSYAAFREWSLANGYTKNLTIDRINNDGNYEPVNCRWTTTKEQARNTTRTVYATLLGVKKPFIEWCELLGLDYKKTYGLIRREKRRL